VLPTLLLVGLFQCWPAACGIFYSFFQWNGADAAEFVGAANYRELFGASEFWSSFRVAFILAAWNVVKMLPALAVAVCIHRCRSFRAQYVYRSLFAVAMVIPGLVVALLWRSFFFEPTGGYLNRFLHATCLLARGQMPAWLGDPNLILPACVIWGFPWVGSFAVLTYLAKLQTISRDIADAAAIDGVNWWTKFTHIELPLLRGTIQALLVLVIVDTLKDAGMILALAGLEGGPGGKVTVPALFMIRKAFLDQRMGYACAVGVVLTGAVMLSQKAGSFLLNPNISAPRWRPVLRLPCLRIRSARLFGLAKHLFIWFMLAAALLPLCLMLVVSVKDNQQFYEAPGKFTSPAHWENWRAAWRVVAPTIANSVFISAGATLLGLALALCAAYFFARRRLPFAGLLWNALLVLLMMPAIANLVPLFRLLADLRLLNTLAALILVGASSAQIFAIFVLRNFIADIPHDLFEAAEMDGAGYFRQLRAIVVPLCGAILGALGVMQFVSAWNEFVLPLIVMRDHAQLPVTVALLRMSGEYVRLWGPLMAGYALASIPVIAFFLFSMKLYVRGLREGAFGG
jgi:multiple sugar transport system permease protein/raffinose/stachyose/melibiose transport system permease protein